MTPAHTTPSHVSVPVVVLLVVSVVAGACGTHDDARTDDAVRVVTSTAVYARPLAVVAGPDARVTALVEDPSVDPHAYTANARDVLALRRADVVVVNGGGYDDFMTPLLEAADVDPVRVVDASTLAGVPEGGNEHVFLDPSLVARVVTVVAGRLGDVDPVHRAGYERRSVGLTRRLDVVIRRCDRLRSERAGTPVLVIDPAPAVLVERCGLVDRTPPRFAAAVEDGTDVSPRLFEQVLALVDDRRVDAVVTSPIVADSQVERVLAVARDRGVPVVTIAEMLPPGTSYEAWIGAAVADLDTALGVHP